MRGGNKDRATRVSSLANEEPLVVVEACVDVVREIVGEDCGDSRGSVVWERETSLCRGGCRSVCEGAFGTEDRDVGCGRGIDGHRGSEVFASGRSHKDVVGVDGDILVKRGEKESVEYFLGYARGSGRHGRQGRIIEMAHFITLFAWAFFGAYSGGFHRSLQSGLERTSPTLEPRSLLKGENLSSAQGTEGFVVSHGSET